MLINLLHSNKALGPSKIPVGAIKDDRATQAEPLFYLINQFITEGKFPEDLKKNRVTPLFKKGKPADPLNYRPISVTSPLSKNFGEALSSQITTFLEGEQLLSINQFGYRKQTTIDTILKSTEQIRLELNKKNCHSCVFRSFKAFRFYKPQITTTRTWKYSSWRTWYQLKGEFFEWKNGKSCPKGNWIRLNKFENRSSTGYFLGPLLFNI